MIIHGNVRRDIKMYQIVREVCDVWAYKRDLIFNSRDAGMAIKYFSPSCIV
jgi:hypothetical protein